MPSPFPGMDPYLEGYLWTTVHASLGMQIVHQLVPKLRPRYVAVPVERFILDVPEDVAVETREIYPDVATVNGLGQSTPAWETAVAVAPLRLATVVPGRVPHVSIEIRDTRHRKRVAAIEILSPTNKKGRGRREYLSKRRSLLLSDAHLIEVDLIRGCRCNSLCRERPILYCSAGWKAGRSLMCGR